MKTVAISAFLALIMVSTLFDSVALQIAFGFVVCYFIALTLILCFPVAFVLWLVRKGL